MKANITRALVEEHQLILRMIALLEKNAPRSCFAIRAGIIKISERRDAYYK